MIEKTIDRDWWNDNIDTVTTRSLRHEEMDSGYVDVSVSFGCSHMEGSVTVAFSKEDLQAMLNALEGEDDA